MLKLQNIKCIKNITKIGNYSINIHYFDSKKANFIRPVDTAELLHGKSNERVFDLYRETSIEHNWKNVPL